MALHSCLLGISGPFGLWERILHQTCALDAMKMHQAAPVQPSPLASLASASGELLLALRIQLDDPYIAKVSEYECLTSAAWSLRCNTAQ